MHISGLGLGAWAMLLTTALVLGVEPNFEDLDLVVDQADGETVDVDQADPHSNNIHVAHNNPKDSDIKIVQSNPFNTTIHISLNVGTGCKSYVKLTNARNVQLHVSYNGMGNSEAEIEIEKAFNSTVHLSFQNPRNTPVKVTMNDATISSLHVSQNIPQNSPMEVTMENAVDNQIHLSQSVPMSSPLTWKLTGDIESNQIEVSQNAGDDASPLSCSPECPQEEYVYDYAYADSASKGHGSDHSSAGSSVENNVIEDDFDYEVTDTRSDSAYDAEILPDLMELPETHEYEYDTSDNTIADGPTLDYGDEYSSFAEVEEDNADDDVTSGDQCPGGDLESCVDVCPGQFGAKVFGLCVASCGKRCP